jgi:hypothetical protein
MPRLVTMACEWVPFGNSEETTYVVVQKNKRQSLLADVMLSNQCE